MKSSSFGLSNDTFFAFWVSLVIELEQALHQLAKSYNAISYRHTPNAHAAQPLKILSMFYFAQHPMPHANGEKLLANLCTWLTQARTLPDLANAIINRLQSWRSQTELTPPTYNWPGVNDLILAQDSIGWRAFLEGAVLIAWAENYRSILHG
jgi:hypothetical protein